MPVAMLAGVRAGVGMLAVARPRTFGRLSGSSTPVADADFSLTRSFGVRNLGYAVALTGVRGSDRQLVIGVGVVTDLADATIALVEHRGRHGFVSVASVASSLVVGGLGAWTLASMRTASVAERCPAAEGR